MNKNEVRDGHIRKFTQMYQHWRNKDPYHTGICRDCQRFEEILIKLNAIHLIDLDNIDLTEKETLVISQELCDFPRCINEWKYHLRKNNQYVCEEHLEELRE
jgi:hypothetical protein